MITSGLPFQTGEVAAHYDDLDSFYREIWGEHVHHGLWHSDTATAEEATHHLITEVAAQAQVQPGDRICDVGCGYGGTARTLVREHGAEVTALTISEAQYRYALSLEPSSINPIYLLRDWLTNGLEPASFDSVIAIESSEHMADLKAFFAEAARVLKPGGRFVVCAWLSRKVGMVQKHPFSGNTRDLSADPDRSRVGAGLRESLAAVLGLQFRENRVYPRSSSQ
jgi:tocopherol O-methyltransferase